MDARKLKEKATEAFAKGKFSKAAEAYAEYCAADPKDLQARLRMGDAWAKCGQREKAISAYSSAAEGFAKDGFLPRAIAASKLILELDPAHKGVQKMLADLYARKTGPTSKPSVASRLEAKPAAEPSQRPDAIDVPEDDAVPLETDSASATSVNANVKGPSPATNRNAIEIEVEPDEKSAPAAAAAAPLDAPLVDTGLELDVSVTGTAVPGSASGVEIEVPIVGTPVDAPKAPPPPSAEIELDLGTPPAAAEPAVVAGTALEQSEQATLDEPDSEPAAPATPVYSLDDDEPAPQTAAAPAIDETPSVIVAPEAFEPSKPEQRDEPEEAEVVFINDPDAAPPKRATQSLEIDVDSDALAAELGLAEPEAPRPAKAAPPPAPAAPPGLLPRAAPPGLKPKKAEPPAAPSAQPPPPKPASKPAAPFAARAGAMTDLEKSLDVFSKFDPEAGPETPEAAELPAAPVAAAAVPTPAPRAAAKPAARLSFAELEIAGDSLLHAVEAAAEAALERSGGTPAAEAVAEESTEAPDDGAKVEPGALPKIPLFSDLPPDAFIALFERCPLKRFDVGQTVIQQGSMGDGFFVICAGSVKVYRMEGELRRDIATLPEGSFFGEMALLSGAPRTASVEAATEDTQLLEISAPILAELSDKYPPVAQALKKFVRQRLLNNLMNSSALFAPFSRQDRRTLVEKFRARDVKKGDVVIKEGQRSDGMYVILSGEIEVRVGSAPVAALKEGDIFGEMSLLTKANAIATCAAARRTSLLRLPREDFDALILSHPQVLVLVSELTDERTKANAARKSKGSALPMV